MEASEYLTPKKFLQCCGLEKRKCTEATLGAYLGEQFLNLKIYNEGSTFDSYFISQTENATSRFFMNPAGKSRRSVSLDKCQDLYNGLTDQVIQSVVDTIEERLNNPGHNHPDFASVLSAMRENHWMIDQEAEADLVTAEGLGDAVSLMILLFASLFQDYYNEARISARVRSYLRGRELYRKAAPEIPAVREPSWSEISPITSLRTSQTYVRRTDLLELMEQKLASLEKQGEKRFLLLYGAAGAGKSELARAYAKETAEVRFRKEIWLTCPQGTEQITLNSLCLQNSFGAGGSDLIRQLSMAGEDVLLVIDNCNMEMNSLINELYYHTGEAAVLLTSRLNTLSGFDERNALAVYSKDQEEFCLKVFRKNYEKKRIAGAKRLTDREQSTALEICRRVDLNPLFISMIACFLREHGDRIRIDQFAEKLKKGFLEAFPKYSQIGFQKDAPETVLMEPVEVLKVILREEISFIRLFGEEERQVMNLMVLFPADSLPLNLICEILGDTPEQFLMNSVLERLFSIALLQRDKDRISIHPLVCELVASGILMEGGVPILYPERERDAFYSHILKNIFLFGNEKLRSSTHLTHRLFREIRNPEYAVRLVFASLYEKRSCPAVIGEKVDALTDPSVIAYFDTGDGRKFVIQNLFSRETELLLDLSGRRKYDRYYGKSRAAAEEESRNETAGGEDPLTEAVLLYMHQGLDRSGETVTLDLSGRIAGHPVLAVPDVFMRMCTGNFHLILPEGLKRIGDWAFDSCKGMKGPLKLPESLEKIGKGAFHSCEGLDGELHLPSNLKILDDLAFCFCRSLEGAIELPEKLEVLGEMAFCFCERLQGEVACPSGLKRVGMNAFYQCRFLKPDKKFFRLIQERQGEKEKQDSTLYLSPFITRIESEIYYGRTDLTGELRLPAAVEEIGELAFYRCGRITGNLQFSTSLRQIGAGAFFGCTGLSGGVDLPDGCRRIGDGAFYGCTGLEGTLRLPGGLREVPSAAFFMCSSLKKITNMEQLSELESISEGAFFGCESLTGELYLPVKLSEIGDGAFDGCSSLTGLYFSKTGAMKHLGNGCFNNCSGLTGILHIPVSMESVGKGCFMGSGYHTCIVHNRNCRLGEGFINPSVQLVGFAGSTAEAYAEKHGNPFRILE